MNNKKRMIVSALILVAGFFLSQCILPARGTEDYFANVIRPPSGAVYALGSTVGINGGFSDFGLGAVERTTHAIVLANGAMVGDYTATYDTDVGYGFGVDWTPEEAGEYYLQVFASRPGAWAMSEAVRVCVFDFPPDFWMYGYEGECSLPDRSAEARPGHLTFSAYSVPDSLNYYFPPDLEPDGSRAYTGVGPDGCGDPSIVFIANASDPNDDIVFAKADIEFTSSRPGATGGSFSLTLNRLGGTLLETKVFGNTYTPELFGGGGFFYPISRDETYEVRWTAHAIGRSGEILASDGPHVIPVDPCYGGEMVPLDITLPPPPTLEPSEENCPPGTYYAPATNRCIEIQIPDGGSGGRDGKGGGCNLSVAKCSKQGLSFDGNSCECVPIQ